VSFNARHHELPFHQRMILRASHARWILWRVWICV
jgi:hypothetical protein